MIAAALLTPSSISYLKKGISGPNNSAFNWPRYADDASLWTENLLKLKDIKELYRAKVQGKKVAQLNKLIGIVSSMVSLCAIHSLIYFRNLYIRK